MPRHERPHHVFMSFFRIDVWQVQLLEPDLKTPFPLKLIPANIRRLARRGEALRTRESREKLDHAIQTGGGLYINLTRVQYSKMSEPELEV
jgi:hypothetical protein